MRALVVVIVVFMGCAGAPAWRVAEETRTPDREAFREALDEVDVVRAMGRLAAPELVPELQAALRAPRTRVVAAWAMGQYGLVESFDSQVSPAPELRAALQAWASDADPEVRAAIAIALGRLRDDTFVRGMVVDADARVRAAALIGLFWGSTLAAAPHAEASLPVLMAAAQDNDAAVRRALAIALSRKPDARVELQLRALATEGGETGMFAVRGLAKLKPSAETTALLATLAQSPDRLVRIEAIMAAAADALPPLPQDEPDVVVRAAYAMQLGATATETSGWVRALSVTTRAALGFERAWLDDPDARVRAAAAAQLAYAGQGWEPLFDEALADPSLSVRLGALQSLGEIGGNAPVERLRTLLQTLPPDPMLRGAAVEAAAERKSKVLVPDLLALALASPDAKFIEVRETVAATLAALEAWTELTALVNDPAPSVRAKASAALAKHEGRPAPPVDRRTAPSVYFGEPAARELVLETDRGEVVIAFSPDAPTTSAAITALARKGFYDGTIFHRLVPNFVLQGGDPSGTGWGDAGFQLRDEVSAAPFSTGTVGLAKAGPDTGSCQLFVTLAPAPHLEGRYTIVGRVTRGMGVVHQLELGAIIKRATVR